MWRDAPLFLTENQGFRYVCALKTLEIQGKSVASHATSFECVLAKIRAKERSTGCRQDSGRSQQTAAKGLRETDLEN